MVPGASGGKGGVKNKVAGDGARSTKTGSKGLDKELEQNEGCGQHPNETKLLAWLRGCACMWEAGPFSLSSCPPARLAPTSGTSVSAAGP